MYVLVVIICLHVLQYTKIKSNEYLHFLLNETITVMCFILFRNFHAKYFGIKIFSYDLQN